MCVFLDASFAISIGRSDPEHWRSHRRIRTVAENDEGLRQTEDDFRAWRKLLDRLLEGSEGPNIPSVLLAILEEVAVDLTAPDLLRFNVNPMCQCLLRPANPCASPAALSTLQRRLVHALLGSRWFTQMAALYLSRF